MFMRTRWMNYLRKCTRLISLKQKYLFKLLSHGEKSLFLSTFILFIFLSIYLSFYLSIYLSIFLCIFLSFDPFISLLSVFLFCFSYLLNSIVCSLPFPLMPPFSSDILLIRFLFVSQAKMNKDSIFLLEALSCGRYIEPYFVVDVHAPCVQGLYYTLNHQAKRVIATNSTFAGSEVMSTMKGQKRTYTTFPYSFYV